MRFLRRLWNNTWAYLLWYRLTTLFWEHVELDRLPKGYNLTQPVTLLVHRDSDEYVWVEDSWLLHGLGPTLEDAIEDYAWTLIEYYEMLLSERLAFPSQRHALPDLIVEPEEVRGE